jgi:uncharacterized protein YuzE
MAFVAKSEKPRYPRPTMRAHYDPEVDIALLSFERGAAVSEEHEWGLIDRNPDDGHLMGFEIWEASQNLPPELVEALPTPGRTNSAA